MDAARKFVDKGQIDKAVKEYLRIVQEDPKDVRVWLKIGDLYAKKGAKQDAIETYLKVARFYHDQGFFLKAVAVYKQILKIDPRLVDVILKLAELYRQLGLMSDAMQHFESVAAHFHREGNTKEALAAVKKLVDLDPENIATRIKLAELYSKESLVEDAATEFTIACDQLRRQNRQDDFVKVAERLLWHKPENQPLNRELAGLYLRRNDPRRALQKLQACFKADPRDVETLGLLAQAFQALDQKAKTVSVLKELARIHTENNHKQHAGDVFKKILELAPADPDALAFLGPAAQPPQPPQRPSSPPPPPAAVSHPPPPTRPSTQMPPQIRAATGDARFNLTGDVPNYPPASARMTGSMPLIDEQSLSGVDFALPEYDDADFSADMEPPPDPRAMSAAGERHAEEISKILAETDVYVKYGLHQKAIDHLRRVFTLDVDNVEALERLKDILISQNREKEAELELLRLAEIVAPADPDRAEGYLQELLMLNGTHTGAFDLARRFRLRVARMASPASVEPDPSHSYGAYSGGIAIVDDNDDFDLGEPSRRPAGYGPTEDSIDDFDPQELIRAPHGSPVPGHPPQRPAYDEQDGFDIDFEPSPSQATRQLSPAMINALAAGRLDAQLSDAELGDDIDRQVARELRNHGDQDDDNPDDLLPFDPDEARAFDADAYADQTAAHAVGAFGTTELSAIDLPRQDGSVEDVLEDAEFYLGQGMYGEAGDMLNALLVRFPGHRMVMAKLREVDQLAQGQFPEHHDPVTSATDAIHLDDLEEVGVDDLVELDPDARPVSRGSKRHPTVMLEKPVDDTDSETHYDLGLAYKEMALLDDAIKAFEKALRAPGREVQCRVMIGMCLREMGNPSEAIHQFKQGLHAEPSERERQSLYYEIGITYE
ncbi:MAG TPA: tetratricopeptide repeat protein, partial [Kofleriaceae bacterium]